MSLAGAQVKKRILDIAKRLPDLARTTQARFESQGNGHPIIDQIVALTHQRGALTIRRLTAPLKDDALLQGAITPDQTGTGLAFKKTAVQRA